MIQNDNLINPIDSLENVAPIGDQKKAVEPNVGDVVMVFAGRDGNYGKQMHSGRPGIILKVHSDDKFTVVYATTSKMQAHKHQFNVNVKIEGKAAVARCDKIATIHKSRVCRYMDTLSTPDMQAVKRAVRQYLLKNKRIDDFMDSQCNDYKSLYKRGYVYRIHKTAPKATGTELGQNTYGLIVNNPAFPTLNGDVKETDTLVVAYGITEKSFNKVEGKESYVKHVISDYYKKNPKTLYFNTCELYEVDRDRIDVNDPMVHKGKLGEEELKTLNKNITQLTDIEPY